MNLSTMVSGNNDIKLAPQYPNIFLEDLETSFLKTETRRRCVVVPQLHRWHPHDLELWEGRIDDKFYPIMQLSVQNSRYTINFLDTSVTSKYATGDHNIPEGHELTCVFARPDFPPTPYLQSGTELQQNMLQ